MTADRLIAGRYRLTQKVGSGAMGVVWRATDERLERVVAVKQLLLTPGLTPDQATEAKRRAMREGRIAARLHHPNAITVFDVAEEDGQPWLVMEYMDAPSLAFKIAGGHTLPPLEVAEIGAQAASALAAAHDAGIMHRDVKPANLLVADDGTVKLTDFGISRAVGDVTVTATGLLAGTPAYLAPEVARGEDPLPSSDVFALGATLYTAVEGSPPFGEGDNPLAILHAVALGEVAPPRNAGPLAPVLMSLLSVDAQARPTMREAARALADVAAGRAPRLPGPPMATKVLPTPGSDATAVLSGAPSLPATTRPAPARPAPARPAPAPAAAPIPATDGYDPPAPPAPPAAAGASTSDTQRKPTLMLAVVAVVAVLALAVVLLLTRDTGGDETAAPPSLPASAEATTPSDETTDEDSAESVTSTVPTTTPSPTTTTAAPAGDAAQFAQGYYAMLPGDIAGAWAQLSPAYQAQTGGYGSYASFWSSIRSVSVTSVTPDGPDRATVSLTYVKTDGTVAGESRWISVTRDGGRTLISGSGL
ncbi:serine/threonine protein kinase [Nocardia higoensis]|uniref:non-specific serine/threonine protein kinase n=1 Tax=Nocardia higoensis TaxID=228599 RepID=A0ABS0D6H2_9NOCA|nr:serine/threonine-protein kinase [Nocardia higoensis]MBF6354084.1 serine/threonine protein kinase [Nocardia higoensis]